MVLGRESRLGRWTEDGRCSQGEVLSATTSSNSLLSIRSLCDERMLTTRTTVLLSLLEHYLLRLNASGVRSSTVETLLRSVIPNSDSGAAYSAGYSALISSTFLLAPSQLNVVSGFSFLS
jgi:hypothetical protein